MKINLQFPIRRLVFLALFSILVNGPVQALLPQDLTDLSSSQFTRPQQVVEIFLQAVDRGELVIFNTTLTRSMLKPVRVDYAYQLNDPIPVIKVYSELQQPLAVPEQENCQVRAVSATLNALGNITDSKAHIWMN